MSRYRDKGALRESCGRVNTSANDSRVQPAFFESIHTAYLELIIRQNIPRNAHMTDSIWKLFCSQLNSSKPEHSINPPRAIQSAWVSLKNHTLYSHSLRLYAFVFYLTCAHTTLNFEVLTRNSSEAFIIPLLFSMSQQTSLCHCLKMRSMFQYLMDTLPLPPG